jgi:putative NADH-flavin reductase
MAQTVRNTARPLPGNGPASTAPTSARHLLVIGASRHTGRELTQQGLAAGHTVTALVRDPARLEIRHERLRVVRGDVLDPATLSPAIAGCDAVLSSLGATSAYRKPTTLYSQGMRNIIQAMHAAGVTRLIAVTAAPLGQDRDDTLLSRAMNRAMWAFIGEVYADMARMEEVLRTSDLAWTIVRPPRLTNKPATGHYRTAINRGVRGGYSIARADLAGALLRLLDDPAAMRATVGIAY